MFIHIDPVSDLAIYDQIVRQVTFAIADQAIKPGELVPSVRELARELAVNPNTVARAYRELLGAGVLTSVRGTGLAVAADSPKRCRDARVKLIGGRLRQVFLEAKHSRLNGDKLRQLVDQELAAIQDEDGNP
jgi:GntR family transcriptional regulator